MRMEKITKITEQMKEEIMSNKLDKVIIIEKNYKQEDELDISKTQSWRDQQVILKYVPSM